MNIKVDQAAFSRELRRKFGTPQRLLDALGMRRVDISRLAFDEEPETLNQFLKRSGLTSAQIAEFHRLCREGAEETRRRKPRKAPASGPRYSTIRGSAIIFRASTNSSVGNSTATILKPTAE
jgi:hypothetical protein